MSSRNQSTKKRKKSSAKQPWYVRWFSILAIIVVASLVFGTLGIAVFDEWFNRDDNGSDIVVDPDDAVDQTVQTFLDNIEEDPNDFASMSALANYYGNLGQYAESIQWYERALMLAPDDMVIRLAFAQNLAAASKQLDAELQFQKVLAAEPQNYTAILGLARLYRNWSPPRTADALALYQQVVDEAGESVLAQVAREEIAELSGTPVASPQASPVGSPIASPEASPAA